MDRPQRPGPAPAGDTPPALPVGIAYATRNHAFSPAVTWRLFGSSLLMDDGSGPPREFPLADITRLRLDFAPSRPERNRFRCRLTLPTGRTLTLFSRTYAGPMDFRETVPQYLAFIRALVAAFRVHGPHCLFISDATWPSFLLNLAATAFTFLCFAAIAWFLLRTNLTWMIAVKVLILVFYVPTLLRWVARNRPRRFHPSLIPPDVLPALPAKA